MRQDFKGGPLLVLLTFDLDEENATRYAHQNGFLGLTDPELGTFALTEGYQAILDLLKAQGVRATFFVIGSSIQKYKTALLEICAAGHEIGNHSFSHRSYKNFTREALKADIEKANREIEDNLGVRPCGHRSPYWHGHPELMTVLKEIGFLWNADGELTDEKSDERKLSVEHNGIVSIKGGPRHADWGNFLARRLSVEQVFEIWRSELECCWERSDVFCLVTHPFIIGRKEYFPALEQFVNYVRARADRFQFMTGKEMVAWKK